MTSEEKTMIDSMDYEALLRLWRYASAGHPLFKGDTGDYYSKILAEKKVQAGNSASTISKSIG